VISTEKKPLRLSMSYPDIQERRIVEIEREQLASLVPVFFGMKYEFGLQQQALIYQGE